MKKVMNMTQDPQILKLEIRKRKKDLIFWGTSIMAILIIFIFLCSKDSSVYLTLSSLTQMLAFIIILLKVTNFENCSGLSVNSIICFIIMLVCRSVVILFFSLDLYVANSFFYFLSEFASLIICCYLLYLMYYKYSETSDIMIDNKIPFYYLAIPSFLLAILFKPYLFRNWFGDLNWIYSTFMEAIAIYPQIILFLTKKRQIEKFTSHYIALQGLSTFFSFVFWVANFENINDNDSLLLGGYCGYLVVLAQILQFIFVIDYYYLYLKAVFQRSIKKKYDI